MAHPTQQIRFCTSRDGTRIAFASCGDGPPLVWRGQYSQHLNFDWDSPVWAPWLSLLTRRHCVVRYDWRGCGLSDREDVEFTPEKHLEDLEAVVEATGNSRFALFGHGGGGMTCIAYTARHPEQVSHLVLCGCPTRGRLARATTPKQVEESEIRVRMVEIGWPNSAEAFGHSQTALHIPDASSDQIHSYNDLLRLTTSPANATGVIRAFMQTDVGELAPKVRCPTLVLHSRHDSIVPFDEARTLAAIIPRAQFVPLESRNHVLLNTESVWQQFVDALETFLPAPSPVVTTLIDDLTSREREVLEFIAQGLDNSRISTRLKISEKTVRNHVSTIFSKLGVNSRAHTVVVARDAGFGRRTIKP